MARLYNLKRRNAVYAEQYKGYPKKDGAEDIRRFLKSVGVVDDMLYVNANGCIAMFVRRGDNRTSTLEVFSDRDWLVYDPKTREIHLYNDNEFQFLIEPNQEHPNLGSQSDGYHTFDELYEHRGLLFCALARSILDKNPEANVWKSQKHSDGSMFPNMGICGMTLPTGETVTYHLEMNEYNYFPGKELDVAPPWDGHTPNDVLQRLRFYIGRRETTTS